MIHQSTQSSILSEFAASADVYRSLGTKATDLFLSMFADQNIQVHSVTNRCKSHKSLERKLLKPEKDYLALTDVTDIAGVRITTYFDDDVDRIAKIVEAEFDVDKQHSVDKRKVLEADRFGYQSLHYVVSISSERCNLVEYRRYAGIRFEIQIRSILQHAWAEIEHDLGYKSSLGVPREIRRRFARVAGLLEVADSEFTMLRKALQEYELEVPALIARDPEKVAINLPSIRSAYDTSNALKELDRAVTEPAQANLNNMNSILLEQSVSKLLFLGITSIAELEFEATRQLQRVRQFAVKWLEGKVHTSLLVGIGIMYLAYVLLGDKGDRNLIARYLKEQDIGTESERSAAIERILKICAKLPPL